MIMDLLSLITRELFLLQYVKCGFAGENFPTSVFPCVVGRPMLRYEESLMEHQLKVKKHLNYNVIIIMCICITFVCAR